MNTNNENKRVSRFNCAGLVTPQRRATTALVFAGLAALGFALVSGRVIPFGDKANEISKSVSARFQSSTASYHKKIESKDSQQWESTQSESLDGDLDVIHDFLLDGLEFAVAGAEVSNQFGPYRQIGRTLSWLVQEHSQTDVTLLGAGIRPIDTSMMAYPLPSTTEKQMATWLVQNWNPPR